MAVDQPASMLAPYVIAQHCQEGDRLPSVDSGYAVDHDTPSELLLVAWR
jgi:hypothetical protein